MNRTFILNVVLITTVLSLTVDTAMIFSTFYRRTRTNIKVLGKNKWFGSVCIGKGLYLCDHGWLNED